MEILNIHSERGEYIICQPGTGVISSGQDILDIISNCYGLEKCRLVIHATDLHPDFFDLKTGLLGEIFLKLSNYRVKTAFIVDYDEIQSERFHELIYEHRRSHEIRFFDDLTHAEEWLFLN